jgi:hypothetical protein
MAQKRKSQKKRLYVVLFLVFFAAAGVVAYLVWDGYFKNKPEEDSTGAEISVEENIVDEGGKGQVHDEEEIIEKEKVVQYEGVNPNKQEELTGVVTYAGVNGGKLMVRVNIDQYLGDGSCELSLLKNGNSVYTDLAGIVSTATTATCEGFDVPTNGLDSGNYQIVIKISSGEKTGTINGEANI